MLKEDKKKRIKTYYLDIDGTLTTYALHLSKTELDDKIERMQEVFNEFKLNFPSPEEIKRDWKNHTVYLNFKASQAFSRETIEFILSLNGISLNDIAEKINNHHVGIPVEWHYSFKEAGDKYYYQLTLLNLNNKTYRMYDVKYDNEKRIPDYFQTEVLDRESVEAINLLLDDDKPEVIVISSSWNISMSYTMDMLKYQGVHIDGIRIEPLYDRKKTRSDSILEDVKIRGIGEDYRVIDDDITRKDQHFGEQLIPVDNGLKLKDVYQVLGIEKEKGKVLKNGN